MESKYARTLEQLPPARKISPHPNDWVCDSTGVTDNLWLNLSTGNIGSGRMHWDGSGGNGANSAPCANPVQVACSVRVQAPSGALRLLRPAPQKLRLGHCTCSVASKFLTVDRFRSCTALSHAAAAASIVLQAALHFHKH